jgi:hypothetical protein
MFGQFVTARKLSGHPVTMSGREFSNRRENVEKPRCRLESHTRPEMDDGTELEVKVVDGRFYVRSLELVRLGYECVVTRGSAFRLRSWRERRRAIISVLGTL